MEKVDFRKTLKHLYNPPANKVVVVEPPPMHFLMIDGSGNPNTAQSYHDALQTLYGLAYTLKFMCKKGAGPDYTVLPLEGLWWAADMAAFFLDARDEWQWTMMIMQPEWITAEMVDEARREVVKKGSGPSLELARFELFDEGKAAQIMHHGPYSAEAPTIEKIHAFIAESGGGLRGRHHEIYLGDPRRTAPEKLKTVIRQPFE
jgi:hypothetical protein